MQVRKERWGTYCAQPVYLFTLTNSAGSVVKLTNYGARVVAARVPDKKGRLDDVILGFDSLKAYLEDQSFMGATIGRFANRISNARFTLDQQVWRLEANEGLHSNHSGAAGFDHQVFQVSELSKEGAAAKLVFCLADKHSNGGFPGNLQLKVSYCWGEKEDSLHIIYEACSDRKGILNLTNHSYFNLSGASGSFGGHKNCLDHRLQIEADKILEAGTDYIPTGRKISVRKEQISGLIADQCLDRRTQQAGMPGGRLSGGKPKENCRMTHLEEDAGNVRGLNTCFELLKTDESLACQLVCDHSGRKLEVRTSYPGLLVYTGDRLYSRLPGHAGCAYKPFDGVALECQYYPDSPNQPSFPPAIIDVDKPYLEYITYTFSVVKQK